MMANKFDSPYNASWVDIRPPSLSEILDPGYKLPVVSIETAAPLFLVGWAATLIITYLAHSRDTRIYRMALWPIAFLPPVWGCLIVTIRDRTNFWSGAAMLVFTTLSSANRWAFAKSPPVYHPLPRQPLFATLRNRTWFKAINLIMDEPRLVGVAGYSKPQPRAQGSIWHHIGKHTLYGLGYYVMIDIATYPLYYIDPQGLGNPWGTGGNWNEGIQRVSAHLGGIPTWMSSILVIVVTCFAAQAGINLQWHLMVVVPGLLSGIWVPEEFPKYMNKVWLATSHTEMWGRRYHQTLRNGFFTFTYPLSFLPRVFYMPRIFLASGIYHMAMVHLYANTFQAKSKLAMWGLVALFCSLERAYYKITGRKVGGTRGWIWTWTTFTLAAYFEYSALIEVGWCGGFREGFRDPQASLVEWALWSIGVRPDPRSGVAA